MQVPQSYVRNGKIVLSISARAVRNFSIDQKNISFYARFSGQDEFIVIPYNAMMDLSLLKMKFVIRLNVAYSRSEDEDSEKEESDDNVVRLFSCLMIQMLIQKSKRMKMKIRIPDLHLQS